MRTDHEIRRALKRVTIDYEYEYGHDMTDMDIIGEAIEELLALRSRVPLLEALAEKPGLDLED